jgi:hypothetical protein
MDMSKISYKKREMAKIEATTAIETAALVESPLEALEDDGGVVASGVIEDEVEVAVCREEINVEGVDRLSLEEVGTAVVGSGNSSVVEVRDSNEVTVVVCVAVVDSVVIASAKELDNGCSVVVGMSSVAVDTKSAVVDTKSVVVGVASTGSVVTLVEAVVESVDG